MRYKLYLDGLPAAVVVRDPVTGVIQVDYDDGVPVGKLENVFGSGGGGSRPSVKFILYNHFNFVVKVSPAPQTTTSELRIVGFEIEPRSYAPEGPLAWNNAIHRPLYLDELRQQLV